MRLKWKAIPQTIKEEWWVFRGPKKIDRILRRAYIREVRKVLPLKFIYQTPKMTGIMAVMESLDKK